MGTHGEWAYTQARERLEKKGGELTALLDDRERVSVATALQDMRQNRFEVAVIGAIKAGKSTFINALTKRGNLLPADAVPCSPTITRLHFGCTEGTAAAIFDFYTREEWHELVQIGGPRGKSLEKLGSRSLLAGLSPQDDLARERDRLRRNANLRLGQRLGQLLGTSHRFATLEEVNLAWYLAAGDEPEEGRPVEDIGRYSDITREATLSFDVDPFGEACTIVDTPGTNDPFRIRSAVTSRYLGRAHSFILLLNAARAFDQGDKQQLEELVTGLHKERIVVFVNRADNLDNPARDASRVVDRVNQQLRALFPNVNIPVLVGSAKWAILALTDGNSGLERLVGSDEFRMYARARGFVQDADLRAWRDDPSQHTSAIRSVALRASGLSEAHRTLEEVLLRSRGLAILEGARGRLQALAEQAATQREAASAENKKTAETLKRDLEDVQREIERHSGQLERIGKMRERLQDDLSEALANLRESVANGSDRLKLALEPYVERFASEAAADLRTNGIGIFDDRHWSVDLASLRGQLGDAFMSEYRHLCDRIATDQKRVVDSVKRQLDRVDPALGKALETVPIPGVDPHPSLEALREEVSVDLGGWWTRLWAGDQDARQHAAELQETLISEVEPVIEGLAAAGVGAILDMIGRTEASVNEAAHRALDRLEQDTRTVRETLKRASADRDPAMLDEELRRVIALIEEFDEQRKRLRLFARGVAELQFLESRTGEIE